MITSYNKTQTGIGNAEVYIPDNLKGPFPAVIFFPGAGERGTNKEALYTNGPMNFIRGGWKPNFIVAAFQPERTTPYGPDTQKFLTWALKALPISSFSLTGLSYGAGNIFEYINKTEAGLYLKPYAIVPMSITTNASCGDFYAGTDNLCGNDVRYKEFKTWGMAGTQDSHYQKMKRFIQRLIEAKYPAKWSEYTGGHCCWNTYYDPKWKDKDGLSIYDFMVAQVATTTTTTTKAPQSTTTTTTKAVTTTTTSSTTTTTTQPPLVALSVTKVAGRTITIYTSGDVNIEYEVNV